MPPTLAESIESDVLAAVITASNANQATIQTWFGSGEAAVQTSVVALVKKLPTVGGLAGIALGPLETAVESGVEAYVAGLISKESPSVLFGLWIALLQRLQADVAG